MREADFRRIIREEVAAIFEAYGDEQIGAPEVAAIMGYKTPSMVHKHPEFFGGRREAGGRRWTFSRNYVKALRREGRRPGFEL